jgi:heptosyltransferase-1
MINFACRHYKAAKPCIFSKRDGSECPSCTHADEFVDRILFIKLDAIGDVLRSASLLPAVIARHDRPYIAWLTRPESVELVGMMRHVDEVIALSEVGLCRVATGGWDCVYSLSNDMTSASIATTAPTKLPPVGYSMANGAIEPSNAAARRWLEMAAFDRLKRENTRTYQSHMLAIIDAPDASVPPPALCIDDDSRDKARRRLGALFDGSGRPRVAVNIGAGARWPKKMLAAEQIHAYARLLLARRDVDVVLVGGAAEAEKAGMIVRLGPDDGRIRPALTESSIAEFAALLDQMDALVCGDTLALHVAAAVGLPTVALFGPTSAPEIEDFGGLIAKTWTPLLDCLACYGDCSKRDNCMSLIELPYLVDLTERQLARGRRAGVRAAITIDQVQTA